MKTQTPATALVKFAPASQQIELTEMLSCRAQSRHLQSRLTLEQSSSQLYNLCKVKPKLHSSPNLLSAA